MFLYDIQVAYQHEEGTLPNQEGIVEGVLVLNRDKTPFCVAELQGELRGEGGGVILRYPPYDANNCPNMLKFTQRPGSPYLHHRQTIRGSKVHLKLTPREEAPSLTPEILPMLSATLAQRAEEAQASAEEKAEEKISQ